MKNFKKKYLTFIKKIELSDEEISKIKQNILKTDYKRPLILKPCFTVLILLFICSTITVAANGMLKHFKITINEPTKKEVFYTLRLDKGYEDTLLIEKDYYLLKDIEEKLNLKILRNKKVPKDLFQITNLDKNNGKISKLNFWLVNYDKSEIKSNQINLAFEINTNNSNIDSKLAYSGNSKLEYYFIENLNVEAVIIESTSEYGPMLSNFVYEDIVYSINLDKAFFTKNELYSILDAFYIKK